MGGRRAFTLRPPESGYEGAPCTLAEGDETRGVYGSRRGTNIGPDALYKSRTGPKDLD